MNIQKYRRFGAVFLACLVLCFACLHPIQAQAAALTATASVVAVSTPVAIAGILVCLGIAYANSSHFENLVAEIQDSIPSGLLSSLVTSDSYVDAFYYNETYYCSQLLAEYVVDYLSTHVSSYAISKAVDFYQDVKYQAALANLSAYQYDLALGFSKCYLVTTSYYGEERYGYLWTDSEATFEIRQGTGGYDRCTGTVYSDYICCLYIGDGYRASHGYVSDGDYGLVNFNVAESYTVQESPVSFALLSGLASSGALIKSKLDPQFETWLKTGIWIIHVDGDTNPDGGDDGNDDNDYKGYVLPFSFGRTVESTGSMTQTQAQSGQYGSDSSLQETGKNVTVDDTSAPPTYGSGSDTDATVPPSDGDSGSSDPSDNPTVGTDLTGILDLLWQFWQDVIDGFSELKAKVIDTLTAVRNIFYTSESILEAIKGLSDLLIPDLVSQLKQVFTELFQELAEWLKPLADYILDGIKTLFVLKADYFDTKIAELRAHYPFVDSAITLGTQFKDYFGGLGSQPPIIYIDLGAGSGWHYMGGKTVFLDLTWYSQYKPTMDAIISAFLYLWLTWRVFLALPGIIQGTSGFWAAPSHSLAPDLMYQQQLPPGNKK